MIYMRHDFRITYDNWYASGLSAFACTSDALGQIPWNSKLKVNETCCFVDLSLKYLLTNVVHKLHVIYVNESCAAFFKRGPMEKHVLFVLQKLCPNPPCLALGSLCLCCMVTLKLNALWLNTPRNSMPLCCTSESRCTASNNLSGSCLGLDLPFYHPNPTHADSCSCGSRQYSSTILDSSLFS